MRVAIIVPRYGSGVVGGAEAQARGFAEAAVKRGWEVEVWTTCASSHYTWENVYRPGLYQENGVRVWRFPVIWCDKEKWMALEILLVNQGFLTPEEAYLWLSSGPHSPLLYAHATRCAADFDVIVALPYTVPLIHYAAWVTAGRVVLWPCLHDEPYAYLEPVRLLLSSVWGVMLYSPEEAFLALRRLQIRPLRWAVLGGGVRLTSERDEKIFQRDLGPFLLYAGRLEEGKNVSLLYNFVRKFYEEREGGLRLVVIGDGPVKPPRHPGFVHLGFVKEEEMGALYRKALALCQPSLRESFSLTIMESWLAGRPVLVHEDCPVTRGHVWRSKGGLWFRAYEDFAEAVGWLLEHPDLAARMGENGRRYVLANYTWDAVLDRFERLVHLWREG